VCSLMRRGVDHVIEMHLVQVDAVLAVRQIEQRAARVVQHYR
jgi:hypothetical protein